MSILTWNLTPQQQLDELLKLTPKDIEGCMFSIVQLHCVKNLWGIGFHEAEQRLSKGELPCLKPNEIVEDLPVL